jgi:iron complex outermembrane recepter protein
LEEFFVSLMNRRLLSASLFAGASVLGMATAAHGQTGANAPVADAGEVSADIIVTATRRSERLQDVAMSVNVVTEAAMSAIAFPTAAWRMSRISA